MVPKASGLPGNPARMRGLTLIELLLAIVIFTGMAGIFAVLLSSGLDLWEAGTTGVGVDDEVRAALERISREVRVSRDSAGAISIGGGGTEIEFPMDVDNDGAYETTVRYYLDASVLRRQENGLPAVGDPVVKGVDSVNFGDLFGNDHLISISLSVSRGTVGKKGMVSVAMQTAVNPRNN